MVMATTNSTLAIPAEATETPVKPNMPAMTAMMAKIMEYLIMPITSPFACSLRVKTCCFFALLS